MSVLLFMNLIAPVAAQDRSSSAGAEMLLAGGEQTVFSASKKAQKVSDSPSAVTVITERDIAASGAATLLDLLRSVPGVDVIETNRSVADVSVRGFNTLFSNKLLVMVDGRSIYQTVYGDVFWHTEPILLSRIKRIEIIRGPGSALYGANAFNGVINIISKTPAELAAEPAKTSVRTLIGEQNSTLSELLTSGGKPGDWSYAFGAGYNRTDGFGGRSPGQPRDSFTTPTLTADIQKRLHRGSLLFSAGNAEATSDYSATVGFQDATFHTSYASLTYDEAGSKNPILARFYANSITVNSAQQRQFSTNTYDAEVQQARSLSTAHNLVYGLSFRYAEANTFATGPDTHSASQYALYAQDDFRFAKETHLFAGVRLDEHSIYGFNFTPRLSLVHHMRDRQSVRLSYGTAFRNPSFVETFLDFHADIAPGLSEVITGNQSLKAEQVSNAELGYRKEIRGGYVGANLFYNRLTDLIAIVPTAFAPSPPFPQGVPTMQSYRNAKSASAVGLELEGEFRIANGVRGVANYSYQDVENSDGTRADFAPQHKFNLGVQTKLSTRTDAYLGAHFVGSSVYHVPPVVANVQAYMRVDARIGYRLGTETRPWTISAVATNLLDNKHLDVPIVATPGAAVGSTPQRRTLYLMITGKL